MYRYATLGSKCIDNKPLRMASVLLQHKNRVASKNIFVIFLTNMLEIWKIISMTAGMVFPSYAISIEILKSAPFSFSTKIPNEMVI